VPYRTSGASGPASARDQSRIAVTRPLSGLVMCRGVSGVMRSWQRVSSGLGGQGVYPRYRAGQGPLPRASTRVETPHYLPGGAAASVTGCGSPPCRSSTPWCTPGVHQRTPVRTLPHPRPAAVSWAPCTTPPTRTPTPCVAACREVALHLTSDTGHCQVQSCHHFPVDSSMHPAPATALTTRREVIFCHHGHNYPTPR